MSHCSSMASVLNPYPTSPLQHKVNRFSLNTISRNLLSNRNQLTVRNGPTHGHRIITTAKMSVEGDVMVKEAISTDRKNDIGIVSLHHVGILCENLERSFDFYHNLLGFPVNEARPNDKLPYRGAWLWVGSEMIHLMELPNPDPLTGRPEHGGRDRHACIAIQDVSKLKEILDEAGIPYTLSKSGRPAIFTRDPDANALEFVQVDA
ncbi:hypothetical protein PVL29_014030 [Vitis rotundifolia]|uniref:VOC domain-containing protein n=1 Tax=Vitis rotundifolia TaxID=103349 RepID=A0AA39DKT5_VITRO|nr:hypothetical protein PVL29_014030 [Vitis rotundifolia]